MADEIGDMFVDTNILNKSSVLKAIDLSKRLNFSYWDSLML